MTENIDDACFWDRIARKYSASAIKDMPGYERTVARTVAALAPTDRVLEIGCGTGTTALRIAPHVAHVVGTDVSGEMIRIATEKAAAGSVHNAAFLACPADQAPSIDGGYDAVLAFSLLHLVRDRPGVLRHAHGQLKPGGLLISKTPCLAELNALVRIAIPMMQAIGKAPFVTVFSAAGLEKDIEAAGFSIAERARHGSGRRDARIFILARHRDIADPGREDIEPWRRAIA